ncbi:hypothetical protein [Lysobacter sp. A3-1-A15]|uniref:hypothetical protein n=1 Tax=Novilysobacter viscosus TaxID=3098602 RepID=UPI0039833C9B
MMVTHRVGDVSAVHSDPLPREIESLALTYGVEARRLYGDMGWDDVRMRLAAGWPRLCARHGTEWEAIAPLVRNGWISARESA